MIKKGLSVVLSILIMFISTIIIDVDALSAQNDNNHNAGRLYVTQASCSHGYTAVVLSDGSLWGWGYQLYSDGPNTKIPEKIMDDVKEVSLGDKVIAIIKKDNTLWMWGYHNLAGFVESGYYSDGTIYYKSNSPIKVLDGVCKVKCSGHGSFAIIKEDGSLWMWGRNGHGQLGNGTKEAQYEPIEVMSNVSDISLSYYDDYSAAIKKDGSLWMWGNNYNGNIGIGSAKNECTMPVKVMNSVSEVSLGGGQTLAITKDHSLWFWGLYPHLGGGSGSNSYPTSGNAPNWSPMKMMSGVKHVAAYRLRTVLIKYDGTLCDWGYIIKEGNYSDDYTFTTKNITYEGEHVAVNDQIAIIKKDGSLWMMGSNFVGQLGDGTTSWEEMTTPKCIFRNGVWYNSNQNYELDFSKDVWNSKNYTDKQCSLEEEISNGYYKNPYINKLKPTSRAIVKADLEDGSQGHCFGMSATVILQKIGLDDLTKWDYVDCLREVGGMGVSRSRICYYQTMQDLWDFKLEAQEFSRYSVSKQLDIIAERCDKVKNGGNPVLLCFGKDGWGGHAVVAYALEAGNFKSSLTGKMYNRRILLYDCNNIEWSEDCSLLFNQGTDEWEIPRYASNKVTSYDGAYLICAANNSSVFDAFDDYEQEYDFNICPVLTVTCNENILIKNKDTGEQWIIETKSGKVTGSSELFCYSAIESFDNAESRDEINIVLPDPNSEYVFETVSGNASDFDLCVIYSDRYYSIECDSAKGASVSLEGSAAILGNNGVFTIEAADNGMQEDNKFDSFSVSGSNEGDTLLSLSDNGITIQGNDIEGIVVDASNETKHGTTIVEDEMYIELGNDQSSYEIVDDFSAYSLLGDVDGDNEVSIIDVSIIQRNLVEMPVSNFNELAADVDGDGLNITDATYIQRYLAKMPIPYLIGEQIQQS